MPNDEAYRGENRERSDFERAFKRVPLEARNIAGRWGDYVVDKLVLEFGLRMQAKGDDAALEAYKALRELRDEFVERMRVL